MKKVWMKPYACSLTLATLFLGAPLLAGAQHTQQDVEHIYHCTDLISKDSNLSDGINSINQMISYKKGSLHFPSDMEDLKSQMLRKVEALEAENGTTDLEALKRTLLTKSLGILRTEEAECLIPIKTSRGDLRDWKRLVPLLTHLDKLKTLFPYSDGA